MASLTFDTKTGQRRILFVDEDGRRRTIRLGGLDKNGAMAVHKHVERILTARVTGKLNHDTADWIDELEDRWHAKLAKVGLVEPRERVNPTLKTLLDQWFAALEVKPSTLIALGQARRSLETRFGAASLARSISPLDAEAFKRAMVAEGLAPATVAKRVKVARAVFRAGVRWRLLTCNPFDGVKAGAMVNRARMHFVPLADTDKILAACPDHEWRLLVALSRFGGLRCPSEHLALTWADIDWEKNRITVRAVKTETHAGGGVRFTPLFPELLAPLREAFERAAPDPDGPGWVITRYRRKNCNLRTQFERIIERAGVKPWPRLFHAMRASRQTELSGTYPQHVVCGWMGNSEAVAQAHYLHVTDADFERAAATSTPTPRQSLAPSAKPTQRGEQGIPNSDEKNPAQCAQKCAQHAPEPRRTEGNTKGHQPTESRRKPPQNDTDAVLAASVTTDINDPMGIRTPVFTVKG